MAITTAFFTLTALSTVVSDSPSDAKLPWLIIGLSTSLFYGSLIWLVLDYHYAQRPWWKLLSNGGGCSGAAFGLTIILSDSTESLLPIACGMWGWTVAVAVMLFLDSRYEGRTWTSEGVDVPEYAIGTPHDPRMHPQQC